MRHPERSIIRFITLERDPIQMKGFDAWKIYVGRSSRLGFFNLRTVKVV